MVSNKNELRCKEIPDKVRMCKGGGSASLSSALFWVTAHIVFFFG